MCVGINFQKIYQEPTNACSKTFFIHIQNKKKRWSFFFKKMSTWSITPENFLPLAMMVHKIQHKEFAVVFKPLYKKFVNLDAWLKLRKNISYTLGFINQPGERREKFNSYNDAVTSQNKSKKINVYPSISSIPANEDYNEEDYIEFEFIRQILKYYRLPRGEHGRYQGGNKRAKFKPLQHALLHLAFDIGLIPDVPTKVPPQK